MCDRNQMQGRFLTAVLSGLLATSAMAPSAFAQPTEAADEAGQKTTEKEKSDKARAHYDAGKTKYAATDYAGALVEFQSADDLIPSYQAKEKIALCYDGMNDVPNAIRAYELFIEAATDKPKAEESVSKARQRIEELKKMPVAVKVSSEPASATIEVDGNAQPGVTPAELKLTPGLHRIKVTAPGYNPMEKEVEVTGGEAMADLTFALTETPPAPPPPVVPVAPPEPEPAPPPAERSKLPAYITLGVAGASAVVGTVFGVKALGDSSDFDDNPTTELADDAERNALISDMAFGVAITLGVTGTVLLFSDDAEGAEQAAKDARNKKTMRLTPYLGPSGGGAAATWRF